MTIAFKMESLIQVVDKAIQKINNNEILKEKVRSRIFMYKVEERGQVCGECTK